MKKKSNKQFAAALYQVTKGLKGVALDKVLREFVLLLAKDRKVSRADKVIEEFVKYSKKEEGIAEITITSARELDTHTLTHIKKAFGGEVESKEAVDESLLGGVVIRTDDKILDGSLKTQLTLLKNNLTK